MKLYNSIIFLFSSILTSTLVAETGKCTYTTYVWNTRTQKATEPKRITTTFEKLSKNAKFGDCTICEQSQTTVSIPNLPPFQICKSWASKVGPVLEQVANSGFKIETITGYRPGKTKGIADAKGFRTEYSLHSFGVSLDINENHNGLYINCLRWGRECKLQKGGLWSISNSLSIKPDSFLVRSFAKIGLKWGGEISGVQKDFMHFSPTGY